MIPEAPLQCANRARIIKAEELKKQGRMRPGPEAECLDLAEFMLTDLDGKEELACRACAGRFIRYGHTLRTVIRL